MANGTIVGVTTYKEKGSWSGLSILDYDRTEVFSGSGER